MAQDFLAYDFLAPDIWDQMIQQLIMIWPRTDILGPDISASDNLTPEISAQDILAPDILAPDNSAPGISATSKLYLFYYALYAESV